MDLISRRQMLRYLLAGGTAMAGTGFLQACQTGKPIPTAANTEIPTAIPTQPPPTPAETAQASMNADTQPQATATPAADLAVARTGSPDALVRAAIDTLGGMGKFVPQGGKVIIKPNICTQYHTYEYATTTNPWVVGTLVQLCFEAGAKQVQVLDYPFGGSAREAYKISGIAEQVEAAGGEMVQMAGLKFKKMTIPDALSLKEAQIYQDVFDVDALINVPIAKHHGMARLTLGMKNLMGVIEQRELIHRDFGNRLTDLARTIRPTLTVIDAVRILVNNGPTGGNLDDVRQLDTVIASTDIVAADAYGATLFDLKPDDLDYIRVGNETGLGHSDLSALNVREMTIGG